MTPNPPETDVRRQNLRTQLAAILQATSGVEAESQDSAPPPGSSLSASPGPGSPPADPPSPPELPPPACVSPPPSVRPDRHGEFLPLAPNELVNLRIAEAEIIELVLKFLLHRKTATGRETSAQVGISFCLCEKLLHAMMADHLVGAKASATLGDSFYELTESGTQRGRKAAQTCAYVGAAPVSLADYAVGVAAQSLQNLRPSLENVHKSFADLLLADEVFERLGRAIVSGKGLFLHGPPGNGKTSIAERVTHAYGATIWIPRAISAGGKIIRLFDSSYHEERPLPQDKGFIDQEKIDHRWVRIRRPTIVVGSELILDDLEITANPRTGIAEAPLQLKSNCGTLVIDDFGRQQAPPSELLSRWTVPLETRYDFLNLASGRKIQVPFDQFLVFSTNLEPRELVDEAFLRRIPYKIEIGDPTEGQFRNLFSKLAAELDVEPSQPSLDYLIERYYRSAGRPMRFCHPRDLLRQVKAYFDFLEQPAILSIEAVDAAASDYFSVL
jgi:hypothetical protein